MTIVLLTASAPLLAHQQYDANGKPINDHQHVWRQSGYGQDYRQGHSVNGPQGSITIWSPRTYNGYSAGNTVRFARPKPITKAEIERAYGTPERAAPKAGYGTMTRRNYGQ